MRREYQADKLVLRGDQLAHVGTAIEIDELDQVSLVSASVGLVPVVPRLICSLSRRRSAGARPTEAKR